MSHPKFTNQTVKHVAQLAAIPLTDEEEKALANGFNSTMAVVDTLFKLNVKNEEPTHQVTGLTNVFREDQVDEKNMFSQDQALSNAPRTHNGYFVVSQILED